MRRWHTIWISDLHLGSRECRAKEILEFLAQNECDRLYLVGDVIDIQSMRRSFYWPPIHTEVLTAILGRAAAECEVIYVPGNHDADFRRFIGITLGGVKIRRQVIHETREGRRFLVTHGDELDTAVRCPGLLKAVGSFSYRFLLRLNRTINGGRAMLGRPYWSLAAAIKRRLSKAMQYVDTFERAALQRARSANVDGIICGHIHRPTLFRRGALTYGNTGDWVENCTALVEDHGGLLRIANWSNPVEIESSTVRPLKAA